MPYIAYTPNNLIEKAMFDFDYYGIENFKFYGSIKVSVSDGFSNIDYLLGLVNSTNYTMNPYSNEIYWSSSTLNNISETLAILSRFAYLQFSPVVNYDSSGSGLFSIASPADVGSLSDINITYINANSTKLLGISSLASDSFGYTGSRGDIFINYTGAAFASEGVTFADNSKSSQVLMHELLHSLGLSHPFDLNGNTKPEYSQLMSAGFQKLGFKISSADDLDKEYFSIMSYDDESNIDYINAYTPMILDVIALETVYGSGNGTSGTGNDTITPGIVGYRTYFDKGGIDTVDLSMYNSGAYFHMGTTITSASNQVGVLMNRVDSSSIFEGGAPSALRWFYGEYENVIGSNEGDYIIGNSLINTIYGNDGADILNGSLGADIMWGGEGNDTYYVDHAGDQTNEAISATNTADAGGTDLVYSSVTRSLGNYLENLTLTGTAAINGTGNTLNNTLTGNSATNTLNGGLGNDILTGGTGIDYFDFTSVLNGNTNVDTITDFNRADDFIRLDNAVMAGLGATTGALTSAAFVSGAGRKTAADASDRIIYNTTTGDLYYDADGTGNSAAIKIALIGTSSSRPALDHTDFLII